MCSQHLLAHVALDVVYTVSILWHVCNQPHEYIQCIVGFIITEQISRVARQ